MTVEPVRLLKDLVRIDTTNPPGNEKTALCCLKEILEEAGIETFLQEIPPNRGNLVAHLPGTCPQEAPIVLMSHIDVVAARPEEWSQPPFEAKEVDGTIYGRGTVDTKQLTVMELMAFLHCSDVPRTRDIYFLATGDEECGSALGLEYFLQHEVVLGGRRMEGKELFHGSDVISEGGGFPILVGDKTLYLCESGQKGCGSVTFSVPTNGPGGSFFQNGDGVVRAMELVQAISEQELESRTLPTVSAFCDRIRAASGGRKDWREQLSPMMKNILTAMTRNTITPTLIEGENTDLVRVTCDVRLLPGFGEDYLRQKAQELSDRFGSSYFIGSFHEGYESDISGPFSAALEKATAAESAEPEKVIFLPFISMGSSDGHFVSGMGSRVYGYSPVLAFDMTFDSAVRMVHGVDERIHRDSLLFGCRVLSRALEEACNLKGRKPQNG